MTTVIYNNGHTYIYSQSNNISTIVVVASNHRGIDAREQGQYYRDDAIVIAINDLSRGTVH